MVWCLKGYVVIACFMSLTLRGGGEKAESDERVAVVVYSTSAGRLARVINSFDAHANSVDKLYVAFEPQSSFQHEYAQRLDFMTRRFPKTPCQFSWWGGGTSVLLKVLRELRSEGKVVIITDLFALTEQLDFLDLFRDKTRLHLLSYPLEDGSVSVGAVVCLDGESPMREVVDFLEQSGPTILEGESFSGLWANFAGKVSLAKGTDVAAELSKGFEFIGGGAEILLLNRRPLPLLIADYYLPEKPTIVEAGAYDGRDTLIMSRFWPCGKVHSFEPVPQLFGLCKHWLCGAKNVQIYNLALSDHDGFDEEMHIAKLIGTSEPFGSSSLLRYTQEGAATSQLEVGEIVRVNTMTLANWASRHGVEKVDFIWLDIEGMEFPVLKSSEELVRGASVIYAESALPGSEKLRVGQHSSNVIREFLNELGFVELVCDFLELRGASYVAPHCINTLFVREDLVEAKGKPPILGGYCKLPLVGSLAALFRDRSPG